MQEYGEKMKKVGPRRRENLDSRCCLLAHAACAAYAAGIDMSGTMLAFELRCCTVCSPWMGATMHCRPLKGGPPATMAGGGSRGKPPYPSVHRGHADGEGAQAEGRAVDERGNIGQGARGSPSAPRE